MQGGLYLKPFIAQLSSVPYSSRTLINGRIVSEKEQVRHGARILLGNNHLFRLSCPGGAGQGAELMDYEQAMQEVSRNELKNGE